jgi:hypothetical protein
LAKRSRKEEDVEAYRHETETRKNVVPVGLASYDTSKKNSTKIINALFACRKRIERI